MQAKTFIQVFEDKYSKKLMKANLVTMLKRVIEKINMDVQMTNKIKIPD
jgi:hypothetical protein